MTKQKNSRARKWLRRIAVLLFIGFAVYGVLAAFVSGPRVQHALAWRLSAAFGRPVEVGRFTLALLSGPRLVASNVSVAEDPRFGYEYFLRADEMTISVRWSALLRGRLEFGTLSLSRPNLNLVRNADGQWNLESWLPPLRLPTPVSKISDAPPAGQISSGEKLYRIDIDRGRINFKRGVEKHPFAFINVEGFLEQEARGSWRLDLEANLMRSAVAVQDAGTVRLRGRIGSPQSRLRPADLTFTWADAQLSDAFRLAAGRDFGIRGTLALELAAVSVDAASPDSRSPFEWKFSGSARLAGLHRWDFPTRSRDPNVNLTLEARWLPEQARVDFTKILLEGPASNIRATAFAKWAEPRDANIRMLSTGISMNDLVDWLRAFRPGVAENTRIEGNGGLDAELAGWPPRVKTGVLATDGAVLRIPGTQTPLRLGRTVLRWKPGKNGAPDSVEFQPAVLSFVPRSANQPPRARRTNELRVEGSLEPANRWAFSFKISGETLQSQNWLASAAALGWPVTSGWALEGAADADLRWQGTLRPFAMHPTGSLELRDVQLRPPFLNRPALLQDVRIEWSPASKNNSGAVRRIQIRAAQAFSTKWTGTLESRSGEPWSFSLAADRLDVADFDRWLNPRWRDSSLFQRAAQQQAIAPARTQEEHDRQFVPLRASGRIAVKQFLFAPLTVSNLRASLEIDRRTLRLNADPADFHGGKLHGSFRAELTASPAYALSLDFQRVNLASFTSVFPTLNERITGEADGELALNFKGIDRAALAQSLEGSGKLELTRPYFSDPKWATAVIPTWMNYNRGGFPEGYFQFAVKDARITLLEGKLGSAPYGFPISGTIALSGQLDLLVKEPAINPPPGKPGAISLPESLRRVTGTLQNPNVVFAK